MGHEWGESMPSYIRTRTEFAVNSFTSDNQMAPAVSTFADGGFVVVWGTADSTQDGSASAIKAQLFDSAGNKVGIEFLVNDDASGYQFTASVTALDGGRFVVTWVTSGSEDGTDGIRARLFDQYGSPIGDEFGVNTTATGSLFTPNVAKLANGGFVISWDGGSDTRAQIFDSAGMPVGGEFRLNTNTDYSQEYGDIVGLAGGGFVATWRTTDTFADGSGEAVKAQVFSATGAKVGAEFLVNSQKAGAQNSPTIAALAGGGFVITWYNADAAQDGSGSAIKAQLFNASGAKVGGEVLVNSQTADSQTEPAVTATPDGGFFIAWTTRHASQDGSGSAIKGQSFDSTGAKVGGEILVNTLATASQFGPDLATLADGRVIVTWQSETGDIDGYALRAQILGTQLAPTQPNQRPIIISNGGGTSVALAQDEGVWEVTRVVASDDGEPNNLRYSIAAGGDGALFRIDAFTGLLSWAQPPQFDPNGSNFYTVTVNASDGQLTGFQTIQLSVNHFNHVTIVSDGGYDWAEIWADENQTAVTTVSAMDDDGAQLTYSITGGEDAAFFTIDALTGVLSFIAAPDYEQPQDRYSDNFYEVEVTASDGTRSDSQYLGVYVNDVQDAGFAITSDGGGMHGEVHMPENSLAVTIVTTVGAAGPVEYQIIGAHATWFAIDPDTGALAFLGAPDFETGRYGPNYPGGYDPYYSGNEYHITVRATDGLSYDEQDLTIIVEDVDEAPEFVSYWGEAEVTIAMLENISAVGSVYANDPDRYSWVSYGIAGGADAALFQVDSYTGELSFIDPSGPDFDAPADADGDNVYEVTVAAYSGMLSATQSFSIRIEDLADGLVITSDGGGDEAAVWVEENVKAVTVVTTEGAGAGAVAYEIVGGADASSFVIDAATGALEFALSPNFEWTADADHDNVFDVIVRASDGASSDDQHLSVYLSDINEDPEFYDYMNGETVELWINENGTYVGDLLAFDPDAWSGPTTYSITGGADAQLFAIDPETGSLTFVGAGGPDFEAPADSDGDNVHELIVTASFGSGGSKSQAFAVNVVNENERPRITSDGGGTSASIGLDEGRTAVTTVVAADDGPNPVTYSITGGLHADLFAIDSVTGALSFIAAPDYEAPADGSGNFYTVYVTASDGELSTFQMVQVTVNDVNEGVTITTGPALSVNEDSAFVATVAAIDGDGDPLSYSIVGGADASHFVIDPATGDLTVRASLDFEAPADADGDNVYEVVVRASDGQLSDERQMAITVNDVDDDVEITSYGGADSVALTLQENSFQVADVDASLSPFWGTRFTISGADAPLFTIDPYSGQLSFKYPFFPDFEAPADAGGDNVYDVVVTASTATSSDNQAFVITIANRNEGLWITSNEGGDASLSVDEGVSSVTTVTAYDMDGDVPTYSIVGGPDAGRFAIDPATGALTFIAAPNYEAPGDADGNNVYRVTVAASDGEYAASQNLSITIGNVNEGVTIGSNGGGASAAVTLVENSAAVAIVAATDADGGAVTYAIAGGADASRFTIDATTGALALVAAPNFEAPADAGANNVYDVIVSATDGSFTDTQALAVTVTNVNEALAITSNGGGSSASVSVAENGRGVTMVTTVDPDGTSAAYSIVGGADAARFTINAQTGLLEFVTAPDWEIPSDSNGDNVYSVIVQASDGSNSDLQTLSVSVLNLRDGATVTGTTGGDSISGTSTNPALRTTNSEDTVSGREGHDTILGLGGDDILNGDAGNDLLNGGAGADRLTGGLGKDEFVFNAVGESTPGARDVITDFNRSQNDKISLGGIDSNTLLSGNQAFTFIGAAAFSGVAGQLRYASSGGVTLVSGDVNGDGVADFQIELTGTLAPVASDFVL